MKERTFRIYSNEIKLPFQSAYRIAQELVDAGKKIEIVLRDLKSKRTIDQNKRLWKLYEQVELNVYVENRRFSSEVWHEHFKGLFIGFEEIEMPDGKIVKQPISSTKLNIEEMTEFQTKIECWCAEQGYPVMVEE